MKKMLYLLPLILILSCQTAKKEPTDFESSHINGMVYSAGNEACGNVMITVYKPGEEGKENKEEKTVYSDSYGRFSISELAKGPHMIVATKTGFETNTFSFDFSNRTQSIYIYMISEEDLVKLLEAETRAKNYKRALDTGNRLLDLNPDSARGLFLTAGACMKLEQYSQALDLLARLESLEPDSLWPCLMAADIYQYQLDDPAAALESLEKIHPEKRDGKISERINTLESIVNQ